MEITLLDVISHSDFQCKKTYKALKDVVIGIIRMVYHSIPNDITKFQNMMSKLSKKISVKKYSLKQLRVKECEWLKSQVIVMEEVEKEKCEDEEDWKVCKFI